MYFKPCEIFTAFANRSLGWNNQAVLLMIVWDNWFGVNTPMELSGLIMWRTILSSHSSSSSLIFSPYPKDCLERASAAKCVCPGTCFKTESNNMNPWIYLFIAALWSRSVELNIHLIYLASTSTMRFLTPTGWRQNACKAQYNSYNSNLGWLLFFSTGPNEIDP